MSPTSCADWEDTCHLSTRHLSRHVTCLQDTCNKTRETAMTRQVIAVSLRGFKSCLMTLWECLNHVSLRVSKSHACLVSHVYVCWRRRQVQSLLSCYKCLVNKWLVLTSDKCLLDKWLVLSSQSLLSCYKCLVDKWLDSFHTYMFVDVGDKCSLSCLVTSVLYTSDLTRFTRICLLT